MLRGWHHQEYISLRIEQTAIHFVGQRSLPQRQDTAVEARPPPVNQAIIATNLPAFRLPPTARAPKRGRRLSYLCGRGRACPCTS